MGAAGSAVIWLVDAGRLGEALRHGRFLRRERQRQFLVGRLLLRQADGQLLGVAPHTLRLGERPGRAPHLALADATLAVPFFSLSHSGPWVACAVSADTALGLDIEMLDSARDLLALAEQAFGAASAAALAALPDLARVPHFYQRAGGPL